MIDIEEFEIWLNQNKEKFIYKPYIYKNRTKNKKKKYLELRFENIIPEIYVYVNQQEISICTDLEKIIDFESNGLLADFYVEEQKNKEGKYYNGLHVKPNNYYDTLKEVVYEEFNCFFNWVNIFIKKENFLAVSWNDGITSVRVINPETQSEIYKSYRDNSDTTGVAITKNEIILSELVNLNGEKIISDSRKNNWHSKLVSLHKV